MYSYNVYMRVYTCMHVILKVVGVLEEDWHIEAISLQEA